MEQNFFICVDESGTTPQATGYAFNDFAGPPWVPIQSFFLGYRSLILRANEVTVTATPAPVLNWLGFAAVGVVLLGIAAWRPRRRTT